MVKNKKYEQDIIEITRGTTPTITTHVKNLVIPMDQVKQVWVVFAQDPFKKLKISKEIEDVVLDNEKQTISVLLSQEDTLALKKGEAFFQVKVHMLDGSTLATRDDYKAIIYESYRGGVMS